MVIVIIGESITNILSPQLGTQLCIPKSFPTFSYAGDQSDSASLELGLRRCFRYGVRVGRVRHRTGSVQLRGASLLLTSMDRWLHGFVVATMVDHSCEW